MKTFDVVEKNWKTGEVVATHKGVSAEEAAKLEAHNHAHSHGALDIEVTEVKPEWTSYRDGRRVMHYLRADGGRYFVQKVEAGYAVTFLSDEGPGVSVRLATEATLAAGKKWVADHLAAAPTKERHPTLADCASKFDSETPAFSGPAAHGADTKGLPPGTYTATLEAVGVSPSGDIIASAIVHGFGSRCIQIVGRARRIRPHRPRTYNELTLGIDNHKLLTFAKLGPYADLDKIMAQDSYVCRIERELVQYAGRRKTPTLSRKVDRLRKILRTLKRGLYE